MGTTRVVVGGGVASGDATKTVVSAASASIGDVVKFDGTGAVGDSSVNARSVGVVESKEGDDATIVTSGKITVSNTTWNAITGEEIAAGDILYLSASTPGKLTKTRPMNLGELIVPILVVSSTTTGTVAIKSSYEVNGLLPTITEEDSVAGAITIDSFSTARISACCWVCLVTDNTNYRASQILATWDGVSVQFLETKTADIGDTSDLTLTVDIDSDLLRLRAVPASGTWKIRARRYEV